MVRSASSVASLLLVVLALALGACCCPPACERPCVTQGQRAPGAGAAAPALRSGPCNQLRAVCFENRSPNPVNFAYEWCEQAPGANCTLEAHYRVPPNALCGVRQGPPRKARWVRLYVADGGYRLTRWFCCEMPECGCLQRVHVSYQGLFLKGEIHLWNDAGRQCTYPLGPGEPLETFPFKDEIPCGPCLHPLPGPGPMPPPPPPPRTGLQSVRFVNYWDPMSDRVDASFTGTEPAGSSSPSFDTVSFPNAPHAVWQEARSFTRAGQPADPKPTVIKVACSVNGTWKSRTVTAKPGRFIKKVDATLLTDLTVQAEQDDGSAPDVTSP